jgi:hypothetical protein
MLSHISHKFTQPVKPVQHEPRAALFLNRFTRTLTIMYATSALEEVIGIPASVMRGRSFYYCIAENCLQDSINCLENAKGNDSIAYLRFWFRDPRADDPAPALDNDSDDEMTTEMSEDTSEGGVQLQSHGASSSARSNASAAFGSAVESSDSMEVDDMVGAAEDPNSRTSSGDSGNEIDNAPRPRLSIHRLSLRAGHQPEPQTTRLSLKPSYPALQMVWLSVCVKPAQWCRTPLSVHRNPPTPMVYSPHHGPLNPYYHHSTQDLALASRLDLLLLWVPWLQDTTPHPHHVFTDRTAKTSCLSFANRPSSLGRSQESTAHWQSTPRANQQAAQLQAMGFPCGLMMLHRIPAALRATMTMGVHMAMNAGRRRRCSAILDWVGVAAMASCAESLSAR